MVGTSTIYNSKTAVVYASTDPIPDVGYYYYCYMFHLVFCSFPYLVILLQYNIMSMFDVNAIYKNALLYFHKYERLVSSWSIAVNENTSYSLYRIFKLAFASHEHHWKSLNELVYLYIIII